MKTGDTERAGVAAGPLAKAYPDDRRQELEASGRSVGRITGGPQLGPDWGTGKATQEHSLAAEKVQGVRHTFCMNEEERRALTAGLVSVIIPCYNQAPFLGAAIESVLAQSYRRFEIIVVDDGSTDDTLEVAARYPRVCCVRQHNQGQAAARNTGLRKSEGEYVVFLDADDRMLPEALEVGVEHLKAHPKYAFVSGHYREIAADGSPLGTREQPCPDREHYLEMLRTNYVWIPAVVMYRRSVFEFVGEFNTSLSVKGCEDYDLCLRIARDFPVHCHGTVIAEYRRHGSSTSSNPVLMLKAFLTVLREQREYAKGHKRYEVAIARGVRAARDYYGGQIAYRVLAYAREREWERAIIGLMLLVRYHPLFFVRAWQKLRLPMRLRQLWLL